MATSTMHKLLAKTLAIAALSAAVLPAARADDNPLWSLAIGVPGLAAQIGNVYPVAPQPVYVAPPVQYVPAPGYYYYPAAPVAPGYGPRYHGEWRHREHEDHRHWHEEGDDR